MIVKILKPSGSFPAIKYNEDKVREGVAERVEVRNFEKYVMDNPELMTTSKLQNELSRYSSRNTRVKHPQFHVAFSEKGKAMTSDDIMAFANKWLEQMGYSQNPIVFYFHRDTDNNHLHVVTSRVGPDGRKIDHNHERRRSQEAIARILGIDRRKEVEDLVSKALAYSFESVGQFRSILETSGYGSQEEGETLNVTKGGAVQCRIPMARITGSFNLNDDDEERRKRKEQIRMWLLRYKAFCFKHEDLEKLMREKFGIDLVFHGKGMGGKEFSPYGYTIVDHPKKKVYKGSEVVRLKELLEYMPLSREEKEKDIDFIVDALIERNHLVTTEELNRALAKEVNARVVEGMVVLNGDEQPLRENHARILRENDRLRWVQEFNPRTREEVQALAALYNVNVDYLRIARNAEPVGVDLLIQAGEVARSSSSSSVVSNLQEAGFATVEQGGRHYLVFEAAKAVFAAKDAGIEDLLKESPSRERGMGTDWLAGMGDRSAEVGIDAGSVVSAVADKEEGILSIGDTHSTGTVSGVSRKDVSKKRKRRRP